MITENCSCKPYQVGCIDQDNLVHPTTSTITKKYFKRVDFKSLDSEMVLLLPKDMISMLWFAHDNPIKVICPIMFTANCIQLHTKCCHTRCEISTRIIFPIQPLSQVLKSTSEWPTWCHYNRKWSSSCERTWYKCANLHTTIQFRDFVKLCPLQIAYGCIPNVVVPCTR